MIHLIVLPGYYSIYQLTDSKIIPDEILNSEFYSITKTNEEISIITNSNHDFEGLKSNKGWKGFKVEGLLDFDLVGIINDITKPLKDNNISVFVISTYNTDYIFVKKEMFDKALNIFKLTGNISIKH